MADKPIIFSGPMVRALLDGTKSQTRRVIKPQPPQPFSKEFPGSDFGLCPSVADGVKVYSQNDYERLPKHPTKWDLTGSVGVARDAGYPMVYRAPYAVGDRLVVKETWSHDGPDLETVRARLQDALDGGIPYGPYYRATECAPETLRWRSSVTMPRWASRLTLTVTEVRCQRLQEISEEDAVAEGILQQRFTGWFSVPGIDGAGTSARAAFALLWNSLHGPDAWARNDWVFAYSFTVQRGNVDALDGGEG